MADECEEWRPVRLTKSLGWQTNHKESVTRHPRSVGGHQISSIEMRRSADSWHCCVMGASSARGIMRTVSMFNTTTSCCLLRALWLLL